MEAQHGRNESLEAGTSGLGSLRVSGTAGIAGGLFLTVSAIMQSLQPPGCIAEACVGRTYRSAGPIEGLLFLAGMMLIVGATFGFLALVSSGSRGARIVRIGAAVAGLAMFLGVVLMGVAYYIAFSLVLLAVIAYAALGTGFAVSQAVPAWAGVMLTVTALLLMAANDQNERILFVVPFGVTWVVLGALLWTAASSTRSQSARVRLA